MVLPANHPTSPGKPKGAKLILQEHGLWKPGLPLGCCKPKLCSTNDCCMKTILLKQPDILAQKSSVQQVIEDAGHLCVFLPKFHCELNFIEFFWGAVKRYIVLGLP